MIAFLLGVPAMLALATVVACVVIGSLPSLDEASRELGLDEQLLELARKERTCSH